MVAGSTAKFCASMAALPDAVEFSAKLSRWENPQAESLISLHHEFNQKGEGTMEHIIVIRSRSPPCQPGR